MISRDMQELRRATSPLLDYYIVKVVKKDGKIGYEVVDVLKEVKPE